MNSLSWVRRLMTMAASCSAAIAVFAANPAMASTAYGDLNNFDVINDTGTDCHGFEIELEDIHSTDITYTYDWNHYGAPTITEDNTNPAHPKVIVRYAAKFNSATNSYSAYTAIPSSPPLATDGHQCTNPSVNFGCEHFGVGHYGAPSVVRYNWLIESPAAPGTLVHGPAVNVATPAWVYYPPAGPAQPAQVQAVILAPPPPPVPLYEFGDAVWVKSIVTTSHNSQVVELKDLVSDDPADANEKNWANGEPDEVEIEWQIMQMEFSNPDGANNDLAGANEDLPNGDEVITRRYEFYKYVGPLDPETNEANCDNYPQVSDPADPKFKAVCDPATVTVLGDYIGAQMAGFNVEAALGLIDHIQDGDLNELYTTRTVVVGGNTPYVTSVTVGALPNGLGLDSATGVLSGTPIEAGEFSFTVAASDADAVAVTKAYTMRINDQADGCPADPAKTEPGVCGCGVPDTDTDGDGEADCIDACPVNPPGYGAACASAPNACHSVGQGTIQCDGTCNAVTPENPPGYGAACDSAPNACGAVAQGTTQCDASCNAVTPSAVDADGDGTPDCQDLCPSDAAKITPDVCGCGVADTDADANGIVDCLETAGAADLSLRLARAPSHVKTGKEVKLRLRVRNNGPAASPAATTTLTCTGVAYRFAEMPRRCMVLGDTVTCAIGPQRARESEEREVKLVPRTAGILSCTATVAGEAPDQDPTNQTQTVVTQVRR